MKRRSLILAIVAVMLAVVFTTCDNHTCDECDLPHFCVEHVPGTAATCTTAQICNVCNSTLVVALGHAWEADSAPTLEPTCLEEGEGAFHCARTGCNVTDEHHPIDALGHDHTSSLVCKNIPCDHQYAIGDTGPGGGIIYYVADGQSGRLSKIDVQGYGTEGDTGYFAPYTAYYLEVAPSNSSNSAQWGDHGTNITDVTSGTEIQYINLIGNGKKDTQLIIAHLAVMQIPETERAAQLASSADFGEKSDWFLPSIAELNLLYQSTSTISGITTGYFWSSSQYPNGINAWYCYFEIGMLNWDGSKNGGRQVRAIRAF